MFCQYRVGVEGCDSDMDAKEKIWSEKFFKQELTELFVRGMLFAVGREDGERFR